MRGLVFFAALLCLAGCATAPEKISPAGVSDATYNPWTCEQLNQEQARLHGALTTAYETQRDCRSKDAAGVFWLGFPVSGFSGCDKEPEIARLKGELQAVQRSAVSKNCTITLLPLDPPSKSGSGQSGQ